MTLKQYQKVKLATTVIIAMIISQAILFNNFIIPVVVLIISSLGLLYLRRKVTEIIADERDYATAGRSALLAIQIYAWGAAIGMFIFYAFHDYNPAYEPVAITLAYSTCILMLVYSLIFRYYNKISLSDKKMWYTIFVIILCIFGVIFTLRLFSGEDDWVCQNGEWIKHGQPDFSAPNIPCEK